MKNIEAETDTQRRKFFTKVYYIYLLLYLFIYL